MRSRAVFLAALLSAALVAGGCAKKELVKKDETVTPTAATAAAPAKKDTAVKDQAMKNEPVKQEAGSRQSAAKPEATAGAKVVATLEKVYFDFDSAKLSDASRKALQKDADLLKKAAAVKVRIEGNCDERGSDEYNLALGEKRAKSAMEYLVALGVPAGRIATISYGKEKPVDPAHNETAWAKNRRDDFTEMK